MGTFKISDKTNIVAGNCATDDELLLDVGTDYNALTLAELGKFLDRGQNVKDYGATGDGSTDDRTALFNANAAGKDLYFPVGTYRVASNLTLSQNCTFANGAKLYVTDSATVTVSREIIAGHRSKIFTWDVGSYSLTWVREASVHWFGAVGDNDANDSPKIQKCLDSLSAGHAKFYSGTYVMESVVTVTGDYKGIVGLGSGKSVIVKKSLTANCFSFECTDVASDYVYNVHISGLQFQAYTGTHTAGAFVRLLCANRFTITDLVLSNPYIGIDVVSCQHGDINNVLSISASAFTGLAHIRLTEDSGATKRENSNVFIRSFRGQGVTGSYTISYGCYIAASDGIYIDSCYFGTCANSDIILAPVNNDTQLTGVLITNSWLDPTSATGNGVNLRISGDTTDPYGMIQVSNCIINGGSSTSESLNGVTGIQIDPTAGTSVESVSISGCAIMMLSGHGINIVGTVSKVNITGNRISHFGVTSGSGIRVDDGTDIVISGNSIGYKMFTAGNADGAYGISIIAGSDRYTIVGNDILGCTTGSISDAGGTTKIIEDNLTNDTDAVTTVASATAVTLPVTGDFFVITGTTDITSVVASRAGRRVVLKFNGALTFTDGSNLVLAGSMPTTANDTISLVCDGTDWIETGRSAN